MEPASHAAPEAHPRTSRREILAVFAGLVVMTMAEVAVASASGVARGPLLNVSGYLYSTSEVRTRHRIEPKCAYGSYLWHTAGRDRTVEIILRRLSGVSCYSLEWRRIQLIASRTGRRRYFIEPIVRTALDTTKFDSNYHCIGSGPALA